MNNSATPNSKAEIRNIAKQSREHFLKRLGKRFYLGKNGAIDVLACLDSEDVLSLRGVRALEHEIIPDENLKEDALTEFGNSGVLVKTRNSMNLRAINGVGRDRFTIAHEIGHAVLHDGVAKARMPGQKGTKSSIGLKSFESAEWQANTFAAAFLIDRNIAETLNSPEEIAEAFLVSLELAKIEFNDILEERNRPDSIKRIRKKADAFINAMVPDPVIGKFLDTECTFCGQRTLEPLGSRYRCKTCSNSGDLFQDGDSF